MEGVKQRELTKNVYYPMNKTSNRPIIRSSLVSSII